MNLQRYFILSFFFRYFRSACNFSLTIENEFVMLSEGTHKRVTYSLYDEINEAHFISFRVSDMNHVGSIESQLRDRNSF